MSCIVLANSSTRRNEEEREERSGRDLRKTFLLLRRRFLLYKYRTAWAKPHLKQAAVRQLLPSCSLFPLKKLPPSNERGPLAARPACSLASDH